MKNFRFYVLVHYYKPYSVSILSNENFEIINKLQHCYLNCSKAVFSKYFVNLTQPYGLTSIGQKYIMELA